MTTALASSDRRPADLAAATSALPSLTGLRWVAAAVVFLYHLGNQGFLRGAPQAVLGAVAGPGFTGVSLFFVLSGFVLTWSARPGSRARDFYRRRVARILPLHLVALGIALVLAATLIPSIRTANPWAVVANAGLVSAWVPRWWQAGNPVSWTLVCEAFFYAVFPLLLAATVRLGRRGLVALLLAATAAAATIAVLGTVLPGFGGSSIFPAARLPEFVAGIALALLMRRGHLTGPGPLPALGLLVVGWSAASLVLPKNSAAAVAFTVVGFLALVSALATWDLRGRRSPLAGRTMVRLGELSLAFYLVHLLVMQALKAVAGTGRGAPEDAALAGLALLLALAVAYALHRLVERPAQRLILTVGARPR